MLQVYRRHVKSCRFWTGRSTNGNRRNNNCRCPVWVDGFVTGKGINKSLGLRDWTRANVIVRDWEIEGSVQQDSPAAAPVSVACAAFMADAAARGLSEASLKKYRVLLINRHSSCDQKKCSPSLLEVCAGTGIQLTSQIALPELSRFREQWRDGPLSGGKKLERLRCVGRFFMDRGWWKENLALKLKRPRVKDSPTMPFCSASGNWPPTASPNDSARYGFSSSRRSSSRGAPSKRLIPRRCCACPPSSVRKKWLS